LARKFKPDPRRWQRHNRDIQGIRALFPTDQSDPGSSSIVAPWLSDTVQIVYPYPPEYGVQNVVQPAAGVDWSFIVPHNQHWRILSISFRFLADANVANRLPRIQLLARPGSIVLTSAPVAFQTASQDRRYVAASWAFSFAGSDPTFRQIPLPVDWVAPDNFTLRSLTSGIQVGDQFSEIFIHRARVSS